MQFIKCVSCGSNNLSHYHYDEIRFADNIDIRTTRYFCENCEISVLIEIRN